MSKREKQCKKCNNEIELTRGRNAIYCIKCSDKLQKKQRNDYSKEYYRRKRGVKK